MRDIKFRAWDKTNKELMIMSDNGFMFHTEDSWNNTVTWTKSIWEDTENRYEIMQYTGLKDKKGKEIYEGDVIQYRHDIRLRYRIKFHNYVVHFGKYWNTIDINAGEYEENVCGVGFYLRCIEKDVKYEENQGTGIWEDDWEVIGNIYEKPELLESD